MILTQCPSCRTLFRLDEAGLDACGGAVRCGQCGAVFQAEVYRINEGEAAAARSAPRPHRRWPLVSLAALLGLTLAAQVLYLTRNDVASLRFMHPAVHALCGQGRCRLRHPTALMDYRLSDPQVDLGAKSGLLHIRAKLINGAAFRQSLPLLSVTILGPSHTILARANYDEKAYLRHPQTSLKAHEAAGIRLLLHIPANASGYRLALFPTH